MKIRHLLMPAAALAVTSLAMAWPGEEPPPEPPPPPLGICHNIGGPDELGANCDGATGACTFTLDTGATITVALNHFLGIVVGTNSAGAIAAHIAHGDGPVETIFDPPLHLASTGQIHRASNVECLGERVLPQPPEPGN